MLSALLAGIGPRDVLPADSAAFYRYDLPLDPTLATWRVQTDRRAGKPSLSIRVDAANATGRLRGKFSIAREAIDAVAADAARISRDTPSTLDLAYDVLRDREVGEETRVTVTLAGDRKEKVVQNVAGSAAVNLVLAIFPSLEAGGDSSPWSAKIGVGLSRIRKLMAEGTAPHADREVATTLPTAGAQWSQRWLTVDYRFAFADADRTRPDPSAIQSLAASFHPTTRFTLRAGGSEGGSGPHDRQSRYASVGFDWQLGRAFSLSGGCAADVRSAARAGAAGDCGLDGQVAKSLDFFGPLRTPIELYAAPSFGASRYPAGATDSRRTIGTSERSSVFGSERAYFFLPQSFSSRASRPQPCR